MRRPLFAVPTEAVGVVGAAACRHAGEKERRVERWPGLVAGGTSVADALAGGPG